VTSKLKDYPQFQAIAVAVRKSGFKVRAHMDPQFQFSVFWYGVAFSRARQIVMAPERSGCCRKQYFLP